MVTKINNRIVKFFTSVLFIVLVFCSFNQQKEKKLKITTSNLMGAYGGDEETENAYFGIYEKSIYYPDPNIRVKYKLAGDTIVTTDSENYVEKLLILKLTTDSLVVRDLNLDIEIHLNRRKE